MKTQRMNLLISPEDKAAIQARAASLKLSQSELIRRAVAAYDPETPEEEVRLLAEELLEANKRTEAMVDEALERLDNFQARLAEDREAARAAQRESGEAWPFPLFEPKDDAA